MKLTSMELSMYWLLFEELKITEFGFRIIWRNKAISEGVNRWGRNTLLALPNSLDYTKAEFNNG